MSKLSVVIRIVGIIVGERLLLLCEVSRFTAWIDLLRHLHKIVENLFHLSLRCTFAHICIDVASIEGNAEEIEAVEVTDLVIKVFQLIFQIACTEEISFDITILFRSCDLLISIELSVHLSLDCCSILFDVN